MLHGAAIVIHRIWYDFLHWKMPVWCGRILTFFFVMLAWVLFRAENMEQAGKMYTALFTPDWDAVKVYCSDFSRNRQLVLLAGLAAAFFFKPAIRHIDSFRPNVLNGILTFVLLVWSLFMLTRESPFIYFNF